MRNNKPPTAPVFTTPLYSDSGFGVLGRVLERLTNLTYDEAIKAVLDKPLGINATTFAPKGTNGTNVNAIIVPGSAAESSWGVDNQVKAPSGGIYASNADLRTLGLSILHSQLLSANTTRHWMKPRGDTASLSSPVGAPWEIERLALPVTATSNRTRISDLYTKAGGQAGYTTIFALSPDHGIGFSINVAGATASTDRWTLRSAVGETFIVAAEYAAAEYAAQNYVGTFVDDSIPGTNLTLTVDKDKPGLSMDSFYWNKTEARTYRFGTGSIIDVPPANVSVQLYPSGLQQGSSYLFRAVPEIMPEAPRAAFEGGQGLFDNGCRTWLDAGFIPDLDSFVLDIVNGKLQSVTSVAINSTMRRVG